MAILVLNAGSSSLKYALFNIELDCIAKHNIEEIDNFHEAFKEMFVHVKELLEDGYTLSCIVHRVVHGGEYFNKATIIDEKVIKKIASLSALAPLHNPANLKGIMMAQNFEPTIEHIAVFDTAFHQSMPQKAYTYPIDNSLSKALHVRRYGFHGTSHKYIASQTSKLLNIELNLLNIISFHIGNGVSACAINEGKSIDTSMGMTPLEGLMMGTRSGSIDTAIVFYLMREHAMSAEAVEKMLNSKSGLLGMCAKSDVREVLVMADKGDDKAMLAIDMYVYRLKKQLGAYMAILPKLDAIVFTGGVGENSAYIRKKVCENLAHMGIVLDEEKNAHSAKEIHKEKSHVKLCVIKTDEEFQMAYEAKSTLML